MSQVNRNKDIEGSVGGGLSAGSYFRSLEHLSGSEKLAAESAGEFPNYNPTELAKTSRRTLMKYAGASMALAGITLTGCRRWPREELVPYSSSPRDRTPGVPEHFATAFEIGGVADGLIVTTYDGRPTKVEGNPDHPFSAVYGGKAGTGLGKYGASSMLAQASVLELYDPDRSRGTSEGKGAGSAASTFERGVDAIKTALGTGNIAFLSLGTRSPSTMAMWALLSAGHPTAKWYEYEPLSHDNMREGTRLAFGKVYRPILDFKTADVVVSLDADLLTNSPASMRYAADWAGRRRTADTSKTMNRLYLAESVYSNTGAVADERIGAKPSQIDAIARALAVAMGVAGASGGGELSAAEKAFVASAAADLKKAGKAAFVMAGSHLPAETQAVAHLINASIGTSAVKYIEVPDQDRPTHLAAIKQLAADLSSGAVKGIVVLSGNPAYDAPADLNFAKLIADAPFSAYFGLYENETSVLSQWHINEAHYLESWGDARAYDGTVTLMQPMIEPMFGGKTKAELLAAVAGKAEWTAKDIQRQVSSLKDEVAFKTALQKGIVDGTALPAATVKAGAWPATPAAAASGLELRFVKSALHDGRYANLGWLAEVPDPMTKITWENALVMSKKDAEGLGMTTGTIAKLTVGGTSIEIPVYILPGQPIGSAYVALGYARKAAGKIGNENGFDTYSLRKTDGFTIASATVTKSIGTHELATTQDHYISDWVVQFAYPERVGKLHESGKVIREASLSEYKSNSHVMADHLSEKRKMSLQLWDPPHNLQDNHAWGMSIDMSACTGCGACMVACQAENNIPTVGKHQVLMHRSMHWIRIDRYFKHDPASDPNMENPQVVFQPMMCQHCETAPCEQVCPVAATVHDTEGLNTMVYNRCIGTRYCSNNCPYKVRRFNYFDYHSTSPRDGLRAPWLNMPDTQQGESVDKIHAMVYNPEVTVRMRGVMEKCTYCTQRIQTTKQRTRNEAMAEAAAQGMKDEVFAKYVAEHGRVQDGAVLTACQQACPTQAIWFGDISDKGSRVVEFQSVPRSYDVLADLNTRPRTKYLGKVRNPANEVKVSEEAKG